MRPARTVLPFLASFIVFLSAPPLARAQTPRFEQQIVVTPARSEVTLDRVAAFVTLLGEDDVARSSAQDVADLLRQTGAQVTDVSGNRRSYRVDLAGFGATAGLNTLVLVDGRRVNQPDLSGADWSLIPLERVERIEVIRGAGGAVLFGDAASGGVINIITRSGGDNQTVAGVAAGAYSSLATNLTSSGTRGGVSYALSGRYDRSDGHRQNADTEVGDVGGQISIRAGEQLSLGLNGGYHSDKTGLPGALSETDLNTGFDRGNSKTPNDFADIDDGYVMVTPRAPLGDRGYISLDASFRQRNSTFFSSFVGGQFTGDTRTRTLGVSPKVVVQGSAGSSMNHFVAGLDLSNASEDITNTLAFGGPPSVGLFTLEKMSTGLYLQNEWRAGRTAVTGGYRYDRADYSFAPSTPSEQDYDEHAASLGATFAASDAAMLFGRVSRSFRYPVLDELFDFFGNTIQVGLLPQRSVDLTGGLRVQSDETRASVSVFRLSTDDEIYFNPIGGAFGFGANENLDGKSRRTGVEMAASTKVGDVDLGATVSLVRTRTIGGVYNGKRMPGVPTERATFAMSIPLDSRTSLNVESLYVGGRLFEGDFSEAFGSQAAYVVVNARIAHQRSRARIFLDIKNLFDEEYSEYGVLGGFPTGRQFYPSPGIHARAGVEVRF